MKIGLALSGGGFRATVFHLGMLARLAVDKNDLFPQVTYLSTVSGGSLCAGMVYALSDFKWPSSEHYLTKVVPEARRLLTTYDIQGALIFETLRQIWTLFLPRTGSLSRMMRDHWGVTANLREIPSEPRWLINTCCYETGKNFRFEPHRMGDYVSGYAHPGDFLLADALAGSAGFPGLIGWLPLDTGKYHWYRYTDRPYNDTFMSPTQQRAQKTEPIAPQFTKLHLWDGGTYDNQGLEGLMDATTGWHKNIDFLLVSDASPRVRPLKYSWGIPALYHMVTGIMMEQVRSLRARAVLERMQNHEDGGSYVRIGNSCTRLLKEANRPQDIKTLAPRCLPDDQVEHAELTPTMIRKMTPAEFEGLFRHGYETADVTLYAYHAEPDAQPMPFEFMGYESLK